MFALLRVFVITAALAFVAALGFALIPQSAESPAGPPPGSAGEEAQTPDVSSSLDIRVDEEPLPEPEDVEAPEPNVQETLETITKTLIEPIAYTPPSLTALNDTVRAATVNILCNSKSGGVLNSISGSGVVIDPHGVVLTNAHVAQYFLLKNYPSPGFVNCIIRSGSPAYPSYTAELLFLPPSWIEANAKKINDSTPTGNGEHDYALLSVTGTIDAEKSLPAAFPSLPLFFNEITEGEEVLIAGYPAGFLGGIAIAKELYAASSVTTIGEVYTYASTTIDIYSVGGSVVAQQGSSGGAVANVDGNLVGLIVTSTITPDTASRDLHALATSYIARDFESARGISLATFLSQNLKEAAQLFSTNTAPELTNALITVLNQ